MRIQPDDQVILRLLDQHRLITSRQLLLTVGRHRNRRAFLHRLRRLFDSEFVSRPRQQLRPGEPARHFAYGLGINGHRLLHPEHWHAPAATPPRDWRQRDRRIRERTIAHEIVLTEVRLAFQLAAEGNGWSCRSTVGEGFRDETDFPRSVEIRSDSGAPVVLPLNPDAFITAETGAHRYHWFLEIDMSTEPHERRDLMRSSLRQKMLAYWQLNREVLRTYDRRTDTFRVLFVTTTEPRLHHMRAAAQAVDPKRKGSHFFLFSTHRRCTLDDPAAMLTGHIWWSAKTGYDNARRLFLDGCPTCHQLVDTANEPHEIVNAPSRLVLAPASSALAEFLPADPPVYAHTACPGLVSHAGLTRSPESPAAFP